MNNKLELWREQILLAKIDYESDSRLWIYCKKFFTIGGCGGYGVCGHCRVSIVEGKMIYQDKIMSGDEEEGSFLACQAYLTSGYIKLLLPPATDDNLQIDLAVTAERVIQFTRLGLAIDIGTTSVIVALVDMESGSIIVMAGALNQQVRQAADVIARITAASSTQGLKELQRLLWQESVKPLVDKLCRAVNINEEQICAIATAGNTVMSHIASGLSPAPLGVAPYKVVTHSYQPLSAVGMGLPMAGHVKINWVPSVSAYIGGDIVADIWALGWQDNIPRCELLLDIGTNGEMVLAINGRMLAAATAAGPAFEGWGVSCGVRAVPGAIEKLEITIDNKISVKTIDNQPAIGICGSGIIAFIAAAYRQSWLNQQGRFDYSKLKKLGRLKETAEDGKITISCRLSEKVYISEYDVAQILQAKAAIAAGWLTLLQFSKCPLYAIKKVWLAGGFARYLDIEAAMMIGLLPLLPRTHFQTVNQSVVRGAAALFTAGNNQRLAMLARKVEVIELSGRDDFANNFIEQLALPTLELCD